MSAEARADKWANAAAEEVLRTIYGEDLKGCTVHLETIAAVIRRAIEPKEEVFELYEKLVEAIHLLSTPPDARKVTGPDELRSLLGERLDAIHELTRKTRQATARLGTAGDETADTN